MDKNDQGTGYSPRNPGRPGQGVLDVIFLKKLIIVLNSEHLFCSEY
jgi:hypothetical protein